MSYFLFFERFEPRSHFERLSLIVRVNVVLNRTVVVDSDRRFDNLCGSHLQSHSEDDYVICHLISHLSSYKSLNMHSNKGQTKEQWSCLVWKDLCWYIQICVDIFRYNWFTHLSSFTCQQMGISSLRSRRLERVGPSKNARPRRRHARACLPRVRPFSLSPTTSKCLLRRLGD